MDDDSLNFGSDAAGATPGSNSILAQPPLHEETSPSGLDGDSVQTGRPAVESMYQATTNKIKIKHADNV